MSDETKTEPTVPIDLVQEREKPRLLSILFFDFYSETKEGKLNLLGIFDRLFVDPSRKRTMPIGIFVRTAQAFGANIKCEIHSPEGIVTGGFNFMVPASARLPDGTQPIQAQILARLEFNAPVDGTYWFAISFAGQVLGGAPLVIQYKDPKELEGEPTTGNA